MSMKANVIQTGSSGNCVILEDAIALDMGVPFYKIMPYVPYLKLVLIGHEHSDHFKESTIKRLAKARPSLRFGCGNFLVDKLLAAGVPARNIDSMEAGHTYSCILGRFLIEPVELHHDVPCYGFKIWLGDKKAIYIVDTGDLDGIEAPGYDLYLVEANHFEREIQERETEKLAAGQFAYEVRAANNHLSFEQTINWLAENMTTKDAEWIPLHRHEDRRDGEENCQKASDITG